jgi:hypothetical protein
MFGYPADRFPVGPYPADTLTYRSKSVVEYRTAPQSDGLGTQSGLLKNDSPICGVAILTGPSPDLLLLSVRLPSDETGLTNTIIPQLERDAKKR